MLNAFERWRYRMATERTDVIDHDDDHVRCCHAYGIDPDWRRPEHGGPLPPMPAAADDDDIDGDDW